MAIASNFPNIRPTFIADFANNQILDNRITFLRTGPAVYYDGKSSALAEQNLLLQSNTFNNAAWVATNATIASGVTDPAGGTTAFSMTATAGNATLYQTVTLTATAYTESIYIQRVTGTGTINLTLDGSTLSPVTITGSWVKYTYTATPSAGSRTIGIQIVTSGDAINIYGSQLENRSSATATNITTTTAINNYIPTLQSAPINTPRFDFNPVTGESLGLLLEPGSTNGLLSSEDYTNAVWTKTNATPIASANIAPDGTQTAQLLVATTTNGVHQIYQTTANTNNNFPSSWSIFAKAGGQRYLNLNAVYGANNFTANFDLQAGTAGTTSGSLGYNQSSNITPVGNGWYRCSISFTGGGGAGGIYISVNNASSGSPASFAGDGFTGIYIWGSQYEPTYAVNSFTSVYLTSYIKTTTATVSRANDNVSITGSNFTGFINLSQGTWYAEAQAGWIENNSNYPSIFAIYNASGSVLQNLVGQSSTTTSKLIGSATLTPTISSSVNNIGVFNKQAYIYTNSILSISAVGVAPLSSTSNNAIPTASYMQIGSGPSGSLNGHIKKISYYPIAVTSANLQALSGS